MISQGNPWGRYVGNGTTGNFAVPFPFFQATELEVIEKVIATGVETIKQLGVHYTVSGGAGAPGTVTALVAPASTVWWVVRRVTSRSQGSDYTSGGNVPAETQERSLDRGVMIAQDIYEELLRCARLPMGDPASLAPPFPPLAERKGKWVGFDPVNGAFGCFALGTTALVYASIWEALLQTTTIAGIQAALQLHAANEVVLIPPAVPLDDWIVVKPDGSRLDTTGSTTNGLQEAIDHAWQNGWRVRALPRHAGRDYIWIYAGAWLTGTAYGWNRVVKEAGVYYAVAEPHTSGTFATDLAAGKWVEFDYEAIDFPEPDTWGVHASGANAYYYNPRFECSATVKVRPGQGPVDLRGTVINYTGNGEGVTVDCAYHGEFRAGTIAAAGTGATALAIRPDDDRGFSEGLFYGIKAIWNGVIDVENIYGHTVGCLIDPVHSITEMHIRLGECASQAAPIKINDPGSGKAFRDNLIEFVAYGPGSSGGWALEVGSSATNGAAVTGNRFKGQVRPTHSTAKGVRCWAADNVFELAAVGDDAGGQMAEAVKWESSAVRNTVELRRADAATLVTDSSTDKSNLIVQKGGRVAFKASSDDAQAIPNGAATKMTFDQADYDYGAAFDLGNEKWTPGRLGKVRLYAQATFAAQADGAQCTMQIKKNGTTVIAERTVNAGGASAVVTCSAEVTDHVTAAGDFYEAHIFQNGGGSKALTGARTQNFFQGDWG